MKKKKFSLANESKSAESGVFGDYTATSRPRGHKYAADDDVFFQFESSVSSNRKQLSRFWFAAEFRDSVGGAKRSRFGEKSFVSVSLRFD